VKYLLAIILLASTAQGQWYKTHPPLCQTESWQSCGEILAVGCLIPTTATLIWTHCAKPQTDNEKVLAVILPHLATAGISYVCWRDNESLVDHDTRWINPVMLMAVSIPINLLWQTFNKEKP